MFFKGTDLKSNSVVIQTSAKGMSWARLLLSSVTVLVFGLLLKLGFWQLDRAAEKQHWQQQLTARQQTTPLQFHQLVDATPNDALTEN